MVKNLIIFTIGAAVGATAAAFYVKNQCEKRSEDKIASMREYVRKLEAQIIGVYSGENSENPPEEDSETESVPTNSQKNSKRDHKNREEDENYHKYQAPYAYKVKNIHDDEDEEGEIGDYEAAVEASKNQLAYERSLVANSKNKPRLIRADEFDEAEFEHHDKVCLEFYTEDCILYNPEEDEIITDPHSIIGDSLEKFGFISNDEPVIYVRNISRGSDYEITKIFDAYGE